MSEFLTLIGQIFLIACLQSVMEVFIDMDKRPYMAKIVNYACYAGALYLLMQFVFNFVFKEIVGFMNFML